MAQQNLTLSRRSLVLLIFLAAFTLRGIEWYLVGSLSPPSGQQDPNHHSKTIATLTAITASSSQAQTLPRPNNLRLVLIGDSLTRYTYLSLVYYLRWGTWYDPQLRTPHLVQSSTFENIFHNQTWGEHSWQTNRMLWPNEICDCYRKTPGRLQVNKVVNNRYYYDPIYNNSVVYLDAKGHKGSLHGRILPREVAPLLEKQQQSSSESLSPPFDSLQRPFAWSHASWADAIRDYVSQLHPPPTHIVMNAGAWPNNFLHQPALVDDLLQSIQTSMPVSAVGIWKTTSLGRGAKILYDSIPETDAVMCAKLGQCWNLSWTRHVLDHFYWDKKHFLEPVYRIMNEDFLEQIGALPDGYQRMDRSVVTIITDS